MTKIELNADQEIEVVVNSLVWDLDYILDNPWDYEHNYLSAYKLVDAIGTVLKHYTTEKELKKIYTEERIFKMEVLLTRATEEVTSEELQNTKG